MKIKSYFQICGFLCSSFGICVILFPARTFSFIGMNTDATGHLFARAIGFMILAFAFGFYKLRNEGQSKVMSVLLIMWIIVNAGGLFNSVFSIATELIEFKKQIPGLFIHSSFILLAIYFLFRKRI